ncbi:helix-turn-helix domain-containing protein [Streptomyces noursei]|uniref:helix-turn-helix domain-containing protein n=1 Tax=Streptomyces noursei TaxID=1971 RepID=UPI0035590317
MLSERRDLINPEGLGLTRGDPRGRKSPGLSQSQMDQLTNRSPGTYGKLERGVLDNPSAEYLHSIAITLGLTEQEWCAFYGYAHGKQPPFLLSGDSQASISPFWMRVVEKFTSIAYVCDYAGNVLAYNDSAARVFPNRRVPVNTLWWILFNDDARNKVLMDWENSWAPVAVPQVRAAAAQHRDNPTLLRLKERCLADPRTRDLYKGVPVGYSHPDGDERPLFHPELGPGWITMCVSAPLSSPEMRLFLLMFRRRDEPRPKRSLLRLEINQNLAAFHDEPKD